MADDRSLSLGFFGDDNDVEFVHPDVKKKLLPELDDGRLSEPLNQDHIKVFLRIRPFTQDELGAGENKVYCDHILLHIVIAL